MEYKFKLDETAGVEVRITDRSKWSGKFDVYVNDSIVKPLKEKNRPYLVSMPDGSVKKMFIKNIFFDPVPRVKIDGKEILLARKLFWYEHFLAVVFPLLLLVSGGAIGGVCGGAAACFNYRVLRSSSFWPGKILKIFGISFIAFVCYIFIYFCVLGIIHGVTGKPAHVS